MVAHPAVPDEPDALAAYEPEVVAAGRAVLDDLAHGRVTGKGFGAAISVATSPDSPASSCQTYGKTTTTNW